MIRLRSLGESVIQVQEVRIGPESEVLFGALLYLTIARGRPIPRSVLIEMFWPGPDENASRHCARQLLYRLRQLGVPLTGDNGTVGISSEDAELDYETLLTSDGPAGSLAPTGIVFLPGYSPRLSSRFDEWVEEQREHVHGRLRKALLRRVQLARTEARWSDVEMLARQCLSCDPLNEEATLALAEATALSGGKAQALAIIDRYHRELGSDSRDIRIPATVLRRRIVDHLPGPALAGTTETQFVGRDASVAMLNELLRSARTSVGRVCMIEGVAGIGKSRLAAEVAAAASLQGVNVRRVICQESDRERPLSAFADLVPMLLSLRGAVGCSPESLAFLRRLTEHDAKATQPSDSTREAEFLAAQIRQSLFDLLDAVAAERCLMLVVENAHRLDPTSWKVFREMFEWVRSRQLLVVFAMREIPAGVLGESALDGTVVRHRLGPLSDADASTVFTTFIERHGASVLDDHRAWCVQIAEGSPFYLRELASHWLTTRETGSLPPSLSALIDARLSCLDNHALRVLQTCVALGKNATLPRISRVLEYRRHDLIESFDSLERRGFVTLSETTVTSRHDILSDAAFRRLSNVARKLLHYAVGEVLEVDAEASQSTALLWACAQQWHLSGYTERAIATTERCAKHLIDIGLAEEAYSILSEALQFCRSPEDEIVLLTMLSRALYQLARWPEQKALLGKLHHLRSTRPGSASIHTDEELVLLEAEWLLNGDIAPLLNRALLCCNDTSASVEHRLQAAWWALVLADNLCVVDEAHAVYELAVALRQRNCLSPTYWPQIDLIYHTSYGSLDRAVDLARSNVQTATLSGDKPRLMRALRNASIPLRRMGMTAEAIASLQKAFDLAEQFNALEAAIKTADMLCSLNLDEGDYHSARIWFECARQRMGRLDNAAYTSFGLRREEIRLAIHDDEADKASVHLDAAVRALEGTFFPRIRADHVALRVLIQCKTGRVSPAVVRDLAELHTQLRSRGWQDLSVAALATAYGQMGRTSEAQMVIAEYREKHRRERSNFSAELRSACKALDLDPNQRL